MGVTLLKVHQVVFILEQLQLLQPLADLSPPDATLCDWCLQVMPLLACTVNVWRATFNIQLQTLFDAHFLVTIARQQQVAGDAARGRSAAANDDGVASLDFALASLTDRLKLKLDVVSYRPATPSQLRRAMSYSHLFVFLTAFAGSSLRMLRVPPLLLPPVARRWHARRVALALSVLLQLPPPSKPP